MSGGGARHGWAIARVRGKSAGKLQEHMEARAPPP